MNFQRLTIVVQEKTASNPAHRSKLSDVHWFDVYFLRITIVSGDATLSIIYSGKIMSMLEKNRKEFSRQCFRERMRTFGKPYFTRVFGLFYGFVKKIEIFQKKACNYEKGMVLFNSSLREIRNSEK